MKQWAFGTLALCLSSAVMAADICTLYQEETKDEFHFCFYHCPSGDKVITIGKYERCDYIRNLSSIDNLQPDAGFVRFANASNMAESQADTRWMATE